MGSKFKKLIYLDYAAATPLHPLVKKAMERFWIDEFGNPSSLHQKGREAAGAVEAARKTIARIVSAQPREIIFTAGGTESVNLAIFGIARNHGDFKSSRGSSRGNRPHIIASAIEHECVLESLRTLKSEGFDFTLLKVNRDGFVDMNEFKKTIRPQTILVSIMYANNEIGTIEPIAEIGKLIGRANIARAKNKLPRIVFHTDACQAAGFLDLNVEKLGVDLMSVNGGKIYGPKQSGFLYVRTGTAIHPLIYGGGQERGLRSGTENVPGIVGLAMALESVQKNPQAENARLLKLRDYFILKVLQIPKTFLNGPAVRGWRLEVGGWRLPNNINICFQGMEGESLVLYLDAYGICAATGSACATQEAEASHVLLALGLTETEAKSSIRFTLGKSTNKKQLDYVVNVLKKIIPQLRKVTPLEKITSH